MSSDSYRPVRKHHRLEASAYSQLDSAYYFTLCARKHDSPFLNHDLATQVVEALLWTRTKYNWSLYAYCLMPDHLHFLCILNQQQGIVNAGKRGLQPEGILDHIARFKSFTTQLSWKLGFAGELWQRSSYDSVLDLDWPIEDVANYILDNPVRKGLVEEGGAWKYSGRSDPM